MTDNFISFNNIKLTIMRIIEDVTKENPVQVFSTYPIIELDDQDLICIKNQLKSLFDVDVLLDGNFINVERATHSIVLSREDH